MKNATLSMKREPTSKVVVGKECIADFPDKLGDGTCNPENNNKECSFDAKDCDLFNEKYPTCHVDEPDRIGDERKNADRMEITVQLMATPIAMLMSQTGLVIEIVMVDHTTWRSADGMEMTVQLMASLIAMLMNQTGLVMSGVMVDHTTWRSADGMEMTVSGLMKTIPMAMLIRHPGLVMECVTMRIHTT